MRPLTGSRESALDSAVAHSQQTVRTKFSNGARAKKEEQKAKSSQSGDSSASAAVASPGFAVVLVSPPGYIHAQALTEIAETVHCALQALGHDSILTNSLGLPDRRAIVIGAHLLERCGMGQPAPGSVIYNFEQMDPDSNWLNTTYLNLLRQYPVWDYSQRNIEWLKQIGIHSVQHVPIGWMPEMTRIPAAEKDIDILFYGSMNDRRLRVLDELKTRNVRVEQVFGVYGKERDHLIARSKIILNLHFYESKIFEVARVSYLLGNGACVVSEDGLDPAEKKFAHAVAFTPYDRLVETCLRLLEDPAERARMSDAGRELMHSLHEDQFLREALENMAATSTVACEFPVANNQSNATNLGKVPTVLNLGSGKDWKAEALNLDIEPEWGPDGLYDLNQPLTAEGVVLETARFGKITLKEDHFELIHAYDVLEHIQQLMTAMTTCLTWLKVGGIFRINVPYDLSWGAWQDPTHVRAFNERSWLYYTDWFWYMGWNRWRFETKSLQYMLSPIGQKMHQQGTPVEDLIRSPRAVDSMLVELRKRPLTPQEQQEFAARRKGAAHRVSA